MMDLLEQRRQELSDLCRRFHVSRLELFGSAASGGFDQVRSDLDFLVAFESTDAIDPFHQYFDFLAELKSLFGRSVDLVEASAMKNSYFIRSVNQSRRLLYAA